MKGPKIVLVGAGSVVFGLRLIHDLINTTSLKKARLILVDRDEQRLDLVYRLGQRLIQENESTIELAGETSYKEALEQTDFVIATVASGGAQAWRDDVFIPRKHGYYYAVGDTLGPGGMSRALRTIPIVMDIAQEMEKRCPEALLINYSNPMTAICRAVAKYTSVKIIGLCHGLWNTVKRIAPRLNHSPDEISAWAAGINHFIWLTELTSKKTGECLYHTLRERATTHFSEQPVAYDLLHLYGLFPSGGDEHLIEFVPWYTAEDASYGRDYNIDLDYVLRTLKYQEDELKNMVNLAKTPGASVSAATAGDAESAVEIIDCITNGNTRLFMANLPNKGAVPRLSPESIVEVPTLVSGAHISGVQVDPLPEGITAQLQNCLWEYELVVDAAVKGDRTLALQALLTNPATKSRKQAQAVLDEILYCHRAYLPAFQ